MKLELLFKILAVVLLGVAAFFLWQKALDNAFAAGVLSACAYFLSIRFQIKARLAQRAPKKEAKETEEETEEELPE